MLSYFVDLCLIISVARPRIVGTTMKGPSVVSDSVREAKQRFFRAVRDADRRQFDHGVSRSRRQLRRRRSGTGSHDGVRDRVEYEQSGASATRPAADSARAGGAGFYSSKSKTLVFLGLTISVILIGSINLLSSRVIFLICTKDDILGCHRVPLSSIETGKGQQDLAIESGAVVWTPLF